MDVFFDVLTVSEAAAQLMINWQPQLMPGEEVDFSRALGRILAKAVLASEDVPPFDRSTVDGFAVRAADTFGASEVACFPGHSGRYSHGTSNREQASCG